MSDQPANKPTQRRITGLMSPAWNAGSAEAAAPPVALPFGVPSLAALLTRHILRDGELVMMILRPSLWFIVTSSARFAAVVLILMLATVAFDPNLPGKSRDYVQIGALVLAARAMWAVLQWMSRLYILTDIRVLRLAGVFSVAIFDCPLRKIARTRLVYTMRERVLGVGSIEIIPSDDDCPIGVWQTVARPRQVHEQLRAAIGRAKQGWC